MQDEAERKTVQWTVFPPNDQAGKAGPVPAALVMAGKERVAAVHGRAANGIFDQVGVEVDGKRPVVPL